MSESGPARELLQAVADIDQALWESGDSVTIGLRNHAAAAAPPAGWTEQDIARTVGVLPNDVARLPTRRTPADGGPLTRTADVSASPSG